MVPRCPSTVHRHPNNQELVSAIKLVSLVVYNKLVFSLTKCVTTLDKEGGPSFSKHIYQPFFGIEKMHFICPRKNSRWLKCFWSNLFSSLFLLHMISVRISEDCLTWMIPLLLLELMGQNWRMPPEFWSRLFLSTSGSFWNDCNNTLEQHRFYYWYWNMIENTKMTL